MRTLVLLCSILLTSPSVIAGEDDPSLLIEAELTTYHATARGLYFNTSWEKALKLGAEDHRRANAAIRDLPLTATWEEIAAFDRSSN